MTFGRSRSNRSSSRRSDVGQREDAATRDFWDAVRDQHREGKSGGGASDSLAETFQAVALSNPDMFAGLVDEIIVKQEQKALERNISNLKLSSEKIQELRAMELESQADEAPTKSTITPKPDTSAMGEAAQALRRVRQTLASNSNVASTLSKELDGVVERSSSSFSTNLQHSSSSSVEAEEHKLMKLRALLPASPRSKTDLGMSPTNSTDATSRSGSNLENPASTSTAEDENAAVSKKKGVARFSHLSVSTNNGPRKTSPLKRRSRAAHRPPISPRQPADSISTSSPTKNRPSPLKIALGNASSRLKLPPRSPSFRRTASANSLKSPAKKEEQETSEDEINLKFNSSFSGGESMIERNVSEDAAHTDNLLGKKANRKLRPPMRNNEDPPCPSLPEEHDRPDSPLKKILGKIGKPSAAESLDDDDSIASKPEQVGAANDIDIKLSLNQSESSMNVTGSESVETPNADKIATPRSLRQRMSVLSGRARPKALASRRSTKNNLDFETINIKPRPPPPSPLPTPSSGVTQFEPSVMAAIQSQSGEFDPTKDSKPAFFRKLTSPKDQSLSPSKRNIFSFLKGRKGRSNSTVQDRTVENRADDALASQIEDVGSEKGEPKPRFEQVAEQMGVELPSKESNLTSKKTWEDFLNNFPMGELAEKIIGNIDTYDEERFSGSECTTPPNSKTPYRDAFVEGTISYEGGQPASPKSPISTVSSIDTDTDEDGGGLFDEFSHSFQEFTDWLSPLSPPRSPTKKEDGHPEYITCRSDSGDDKNGDNNSADEGSAIFSFFFPNTPKSLA